MAKSVCGRPDDKGFNAGGVSGGKGQWGPSLTLFMTLK